jgi:hypothetical protein
MSSSKSIRTYRSLDFLSRQAHVWCQLVSLIEKGLEIHFLIVLELWTPVLTWHHCFYNSTVILVLILLLAIRNQNVSNIDRVCERYTAKSSVVWGPDPVVRRYSPQSLSETVPRRPPTHTSDSPPIDVHPTPTSFQFRVLYTYMCMYLYILDHNVHMTLL